MDSRWRFSPREDVGNARALQALGEVLISLFPTYFLFCFFMCSFRVLSQCQSQITGASLSHTFYSASWLQTTRPQSEWWWNKFWALAVGMNARWISNNNTCDLSSWLAVVQSTWARSKNDCFIICSFPSVCDHNRAGEETCPKLWRWRDSWGMH